MELNGWNGQIFLMGGGHVNFMEIAPEYVQKECPQLLELQKPEKNSPIKENCRRTENAPGKRFNRRKRNP
jgi:hypothetical protein